MSKINSEKNSGYTQFLQDIKENLNIKPWNDWRSKSDKDRIGVSWCLGGTYGNCWDDHKSSVGGDVEPNFSILDTILEHYCADISYLQYKSIVNKLLHRDQKFEGDYYGGSVSYGYKYVYLEDLYDWLKEKEFVK